MKTTSIDLVLDNGELVRIEVPERFEDDFKQLLEDTMKRRDWLCAGTFDDTRFTYMGHRIDRVNMGRVVGTL